MEKVQSFLKMLAMTVALLGVTACGGDDNDDEIDNGGGISIQELEGTWAGELPYYYYRINGEYANIYETIWTFFRDGSGYSVEYLCDENDVYKGYFAQHIKWSTNNDIIQIYFVEMDTNVEVHLYNMSIYVIRGECYFDGDYWGNITFKKTATPDYSNYSWGIPTL
jgi:hypothetical protein